MMITRLSYLVIFGMGKWMGPTRKLSYLAGGAIGSAPTLSPNYLFIFWIANPAYIKSLGGLLQACTLVSPDLLPRICF